MNIYEIEKRATPGPWMASEGWNIGERLDHDVVTTCEEGGGEVVAEVLKDPCSHQLASMINAKLIAHCRNNFLRALEALKNCETKLHDEGFYLEADFLHGKIKELEEVE